MLQRMLLVALFASCFLLLPAASASDALLVQGGEPRSEIVVAENPSRSTRLAAAELRTYIKKISGATVPIVTTSSENMPVHVFVGRSKYTEKLGITDEGLKYGAYRIASGDNWLALIGDDTDFVPREPWARNNTDRSSGKLQREWEMLTGEPFGVPDGGMYKNRSRLPGDVGKPDGAATLKNETLEIWGFDERGSFNAVCGFLRSLGVRWYLPGELGEVVPKMASIPLPKIDQTVRPDFEVRQFNVRFGTVNEATMMWFARLGIRQPHGLMIAHGMHTMTQTETVLREHPDWFARYGGTRDTEPGKRLNHLCYSNPELFEATVRWARAQLDVYDFESVSIMPPDAYISICQCPLCEGKEVSEMGARGKLSNHVWDFVNRVAREVGKTHPDKKIVCCAYGANTDPPANIAKLEPNVQVIIVGGRRPRNNLPEQRLAVGQLRAGWLEKSDNPIMIFENYPFTSRGFYLPAFTARTIGESINATKGESRGEDIWLSIGGDFETEGIGFNHFQVYFTARMYWGGPEQDVEALLREYCQLFYGPAGTPMLDFFQYCEDHWQEMEQEEEAVNAALQLFAMAQASVAADSAYGRRLAIIDQFLEALRSKAQLLRQKRGPVSKLRLVWEPKQPIVIDGKLDDQYWRDCPTSSIGQLRELQTGRQPIYGTTIKAGWHQGNLYFGIRCDEHPGEALNIATTKNEDQSIWYGDTVEIHLDTDSHSYYQIAVNPAGALIDLDRGADKGSWFRWQSQAEVATHVGEDHWTVELRIPVTEDENDPLNQVIGRKPSQSLPWHFNLCRQRIRPSGTELSAFSPTGTAGFHEPMKFAHLYDGRSHTFDADPSVTDYLISSRSAVSAVRAKEYRHALAAYVALAEGEQMTDLQKSDALQHAAACARSLGDFERADQLAMQVPLASVAKTAQMQNFAAKRGWQELIDQFGDEAIDQWPFWQIGAGVWERGRAYYQLDQGPKAAADLELALAYTSDSRARLNIALTIARNQEEVLKNDEEALASYLAIAKLNSHAGSADYFYSVQGAARILTRQRDFAQAIQTLNQVDTDALRGNWRGSMLLARGSTLEAAGRQEDARKLYQSMLTNDGIELGQKRLAGERIESLGKSISSER